MWRLLILLGIILIIIYLRGYKVPVRENYEIGMAFQEYAETHYRKRGIHIDYQKTSRTTGKRPDGWIGTKRAIYEFKNVLELTGLIVREIKSKYSRPWFPKEWHICVPCRTVITDEAKAMERNDEKLAIHRLHGYKACERGELCRREPCPLKKSGGRG